MTPLISGRIIKFGRLMWNLILSAAGCIVFTRCYRLAAIGRETSDRVGSISVVDSPSEPLVGVSAALFLLAFIASELLHTIGVFRR